MSELVGCKYCGNTIYQIQQLYKDCHITVVTLKCGKCIAMPTRVITMDVWLSSDQAYNECESVWNLLNKKEVIMNCPNPMCVHGKDQNCCNPDHNIKRYKKNATQAMRPYVVGEDLTGVSVSEEDTPELGGMIAIGADNNARWYVSKTFFDENYVEA